MRYENQEKTSGPLSLIAQEKPGPPKTPTDLPPANPIGVRQRDEEIRWAPASGPSRRWRAGRPACAGRRTGAVLGAGPRTKGERTKGPENKGVRPLFVDPFGLRGAKGGFAETPRSQGAVVERATPTKHPFPALSSVRAAVSTAGSSDAFANPRVFCPERGAARQARAARRHFARPWRARVPSQD